MRKNHVIKRTSFTFLLLLLTVAFLGLSHKPIQAQSTAEIMYDYILLIDTSGSMNEGTPSLFEQVKKVSIDFVKQLPTKSNLSVFTFDTEITHLGRWDNISPYSKEGIVQKISALNANGNYTALWDAVCAGVTEMELMSQSDATHIQLLISYTDGKDNISKNPSSTCLDRYLLLQKNGFTYWIYNALSGVEIPTELLNIQEFLGINRSENPSPIRVAQFQPFSLNFGNLLEENTIPQGCTVFWLSDPSIEGKIVEFRDPPTAVQDLPDGTAAQICASGTTCDHYVTVSTDKVCFDFDLVNLNVNNLAGGDYGEYHLSLPLMIDGDVQQGPIYIMPNKLEFQFQLVQADTPMPTVTATEKPIPTVTPEPTSTLDPTDTPEPTSTPARALAAIQCQGKPEIDLGRLKPDKNGAIEVMTECRIDVTNGPLSQPIKVRLESEQNEVLGFISLVAGSSSGNLIVVDESIPEMSIRLNVPAEYLSTLKGGNHKFRSNLVFEAVEVDLTGDFEEKTNQIPLYFQIYKPKSKIPYIILGGVLGLLVLFGLTKRMINQSKPPTFKLVMRWEGPLGRKTMALMKFIPSKVKGKKYSLSVGSSPVSNVVVPGLPEKAFEIMGIKGKDAVEYYLVPKTEVRKNGRIVNEQFMLKAEEKFMIDETTIDFLIG